MRTISLAVTAVASALLLTACNSSGGSSSDSKNGSACSFDGVAVQVGPASTAPSAGDTGEVPVSLTNQSKPCTLDGFAGASLESGGAKVALATQQGAKAQKLKLAKGDAASFTITYVRGKAGAKLSLAATKLVVTLPGSSDSMSYKWSYGPVQGKTSVSDSDASVSAFTQAGD
jgi:predicted small secreted protein